MRLFVDCDDTLVLYHDGAMKHPYGVYNGTPWSENKPLIQAVLKWQQETGGEVVIWSGGGRDYAQMWSDRLFPQMGFAGMAKDNRVTNAQDILIDDEDLHMTRIKGRWFTAASFVARLTLSRQL